MYEHLHQILCPNINPNMRVRDMVKRALKQSENAKKQSEFVAHVKKVHRSQAVISQIHHCLNRVSSLTSPSLDDAQDSNASHARYWDTMQVTLEDLATH